MSEEIIQDLKDDKKIHEWVIEQAEFKIKNIDKIMLQFKKQIKNEITRAKQEIDLLKEQTELFNKKTVEVEKK